MLYWRITFSHFPFTVQRILDFLLQFCTKMIYDCLMPSILTVALLIFGLDPCLRYVLGVGWEAALCYVGYSAASLASSVKCQ